MTDTGNITRTPGTETARAPPAAASGAWKT